MRQNQRRRTRRHLGAAVTALAVVLGGAVTAVVTTNNESANASRPAISRGEVPPVPRTTSHEVVDETPTGPNEVTDEDEYAVMISAAVFTVDTRTSTPAQLRDQLRAVADPLLSAKGLGDLYATIDARVPTDPLWERMRSNGQWSEWEPTRTWEPAAWAQVVTGGHAQPGWVMRNVTGVQTTHYLEDGVNRSASREATLTVVMRCPAEGLGLATCALVLISTQPVF